MNRGNELGPFTDHDGKPPKEELVQLCLEWLRDYGKLRPTVNRTICSYSWKHVVEYDYGPTHIPHLAFLEAARRFGLKMVREREQDTAIPPHYCVNLSTRCDNGDWMGPRRGRRQDREEGERHERH